jgi:N-acyl-D-aspartate/D-glutamate deacylase
MFGASAFSNVSPQFELSVYSSLIGKTVTAINPSTGKEITDIVKSVLIQNGQVMLDVNGVTVPPANIVRITK